MFSPQEELPSEMPIQLPHGSHTSNRLNFAESPRLLPPHGYQAHVMGPGQGNATVGFAIAVCRFQDYSDAVWTIDGADSILCVWHLLRTSKPPTLPGRSSSNEPAQWTTQAEGSTTSRHDSIADSDR